MALNRKLFTFNGGVHPDGHKAESSATPIRDMPLLPRYVFSDKVNTRLLQAQHGDSSGVRGAAWLWNDGLR